jgi:hypothetical protein
MNSCFEAPDLDELHCATEVTGGALGLADDNQFFQGSFGVSMPDVCQDSRLLFPAMTWLATSAT